MPLTIDILALIILLFFLLTGWHKGFLISLLSVTRIIFCCGGAYFSGRYLGTWLGEIAHRPQIIVVPLCASMAFILIFFALHMVMHNIRERHNHKVQKEEFHLPFLSALSGALINVSAGLLALIVLFWMGDLFLVGIAGTPIPGADQARFGRLTRSTIYKITYASLPKTDNEQQLETIATLISNPASGMDSLKKILEADSIQQLITDPVLADDILSGDVMRIAENLSIQNFFDDTASMNELKKIGFFSGNEKKSDICRNLASFGQNEKIRYSVQQIKSRDLLRTDKIMLLIRDPDFDVIVGEILK